VVSKMSESADRLLAAVLAEQRRRGRKLPLSPKTSRKPQIQEIGGFRRKADMPSQMGMSAYDPKLLRQR
jgi:hypothetical protein